MAANILTCPECGKHSNIPMPPGTCWGCGQVLSVAIVDQPSPAPPAPPRALSEVKLRRSYRKTTPGIGFGGVIGLLVVPAFFVFQCTPIGMSANGKRLEGLRGDLTLASRELDTAEDTCTRRSVEAHQAVGKRALASWDTAAANNLDSVSKQQEHEIRAALGREMGLAPSQVNGWRDIYRGRAQDAASKRPEVERQIEAAEKEAGVVCGWRDRLKGNVERLQAEIRGVEDAAKRQG